MGLRRMRRRLLLLKGSNGGFSARVDNDLWTIPAGCWMIAMYVAKYDVLLIVWLRSSILTERVNDNDNRWLVIMRSRPLSLAPVVVDRLASIFIMSQSTKHVDDKFRICLIITIIPLCWSQGWRVSSCCLESTSKEEDTHQSSNSRSSLGKYSREEEVKKISPVFKRREGPRTTYVLTTCLYLQ